MLLLFIEINYSDCIFLDSFCYFHNQVNLYLRGPNMKLLQQETFVYSIWCLIDPQLTWIYAAIIKRKRQLKIEINECMDSDSFLQHNLVEYFIGSKMNYIQREPVVLVLDAHS